MISEWTTFETEERFTKGPMSWLGGGAYDNSLRGGKLVTYLFTRLIYLWLHVDMKE